MNWRRNEHMTGERGHTLDQTISLFKRSRYLHDWRAAAHWANQAARLVDKESDKAYWLSEAEAYQHAHDQGPQLFIKGPKK